MARICGDLHFLNKNNNKSTNAQINKWIKEMIALYGTQIDYFVYDYKLERHDYLLGEDRPAPFLPPVSMRAIVNINNDNLMLSKFGLQTQSDLVMYVDYKTYATALGDNLARPKAGDLIRLTELGMDRPLGPYGFPYYGAPDEGSGDGDGGNKCINSSGDCNFVDDIDSIICCTDPNKGDGDDDYSTYMEKISAWAASGKAPFGPNIYEITTVKDEDIAGNLNPMLGHYVWKIEAIRFDNSYQPNAPVENGSNMVNDAPYYGKLPGGTETPENGKLYPQTTDKEEDRYWDHEKYQLDSVYGGYGYRDKELPDIKITYDPKTDPYSPDYWVIYDTIPFVDLGNPDPFTAKFYNIVVENEEIGIEKFSGTPPKYNEFIYMRDTGECMDSNRLIVYKVFVDSGSEKPVSIQYIGNENISNINDIIYSSILVRVKTDQEEQTDQQEDDNEDHNVYARIWIRNGSLTLTQPVTEEDKDGDGTPDSEEKPEEKPENKYTDTKTKFSDDETDPSSLIINTDPIPEPEPEPIVYIVIWLNGNGNRLDRKTYNEGEVEPTTNKIPTKAEDDTYTYTFDKWVLYKTEGNTKTYKPEFTATAKPEPEPIVYTVIWLNDDGSQLDIKTYIEGETEPTTDKTPTKAEDDTYTYTFDEWILDKTENNTITYRPAFTATEKPAPPPPIPYDAEVQYIKSNGDTYIDTGIPTNTAGLKIEIKARYDVYISWSALISSFVDEGTNTFRIIQQNNNNGQLYVNCGWVASSSHVPTAQVGTWHTFILDGLTDTLIVDGVDKSKGARKLQGNTNNRTIGIFANAVNKGGKSKASLEYIKIWVFDELIMDCISVRKDGYGYLYDKVSKNIIGPPEGNPMLVAGPDK